MEEKENVISVSAEETAAPEEQSAPAAPDGETKHEYEPKGIAKVLDRFFKFKKRGSTMKKEIVAGISVFLVSVCVLLVNTRIICETLGAGREGYVGTYLAATIVSFVGTMAIGLIGNLPLVQVSSLGLSTAFVSLLGAENGLTYHNLLAVSFVSAIVYTVVMAVPQSRRFVMNALPAPVRNALPVGMGLYMISYAVESSGLLEVAGQASAQPDTLGVIAIAAGLIAAAAVVIFKKLRLAHPYLWGFLVGVLLYYLLGVIFAMNSVFTVNRGYIAFGAENMYSIGFGFTGLEFGAVFTKGFDFSAYDGNVFMLFAGGIFTFMFMGMYETESAVSSAALEGAEDEGARGKVLLVNAATNLVAPILGSAPVSAGRQSAAAAGDGGRTGLTSVTAGVGYLVAAFTWLFFALLATYTAPVAEYGHVTSNSFAEYASAGFAITDGVMLALGLFMMKGVGNVKVADIGEFVPFAATAALLAVTRNIVLAATAGTIAYVIMKLLSFRPGEIRSIGIPTAVLAAVLLFSSIAM